MRVDYIGHATVRIDIGGVSLLTDPVLTGTIGHLKRHVGPAPVTAGADLSAVLISHAHGDHLHQPSLALLPDDVPIIGPRGIHHHLPKTMRRRLTELSVGASLDLEGIRIHATPSAHDGRRWPLVGRRADSIGYEIVGAGRRIYFAGDTDLFSGMQYLAGPTQPRLDLALLPVAGWGLRLGPGHLNPESAAVAASILRPRLAVPIHWGTFFPTGLHRFGGDRRLVRPPLEFAEHARRLAPDVEVRLIEPASDAVELF